jgi:hypothetical protein
MRILTPRIYSKQRQNLIFNDLLRSFDEKIEEKTKNDYLNFET